MKNRLKKGVTAIEYGLLAALIAIAALFVIELTGVNLKNVFEDIGGGLNGSSVSSGPLYASSSWTSAGAYTFVCQNPNNCTEYSFNNTNGLEVNEYTPGVYYAGGSYNTANVSVSTTSTANVVPVGSKTLTLPDQTVVAYDLAASSGSVSLSSGSSAADITALQNLCSSNGGTYSLFTDPNFSSSYSNMPTCNGLSLDTSAATTINNLGVPNKL